MPRIRQNKVLTAPPEPPPAHDTREVRETLRDWFDWCAERGQPLTPLRGRKAVAMLIAIGNDAFVAAVDHSIRSGYQGLFQDPHFGAGKRRRPGAYTAAANFADIVSGQAEPPFDWRVEARETKVWGDLTEQAPALRDMSWSQLPQTVRQDLYITIQANLKRKRGTQQALDG